MTIARRLWTCRAGATAAEFALVLPILLLLLFAVIDGARFLWEYNRAEKATQVGARYAAATQMVAGGFAGYSFAVSDAIPAGDPVPVANFDKVTCTSTACTCVGGGVCSVVSRNAAAFDAVVARMNKVKSDIAAQNVVVTYRNVGLGYAGDPNGADVAPLITVSLQALDFKPITTLIFGITMQMPSFKASLTAEDLDGSVSN